MPDRFFLQPLRNRHFDLGRMTGHPLRDNQRHPRSSRRPGSPDHSSLRKYLLCAARRISEAS
jgi:hypothetical protein